MDAIDVFARYAMAFEEACGSDDWSTVSSFFTDDAVYETFAGPPFGGRHEGRSAVIEHLKESVDGFDRRFDTREPPELLAGPELRDGAVWIRWRVIYRLAGAPPLALEGEETAVFDGDRICRLEDRFEDEMSAAVIEWMDAHGDKLK
jgi:hypothetical protein